MRSTALLRCLLNALFAVVMILTADHALGDQTLAQEDPTGQPVADAKREPDVLQLIVKQSPKPNYDSPVPAQISGRVLLHSASGAGPLSGKEASGAKGVSITDGYTVVKTDAQGKYTLKPNEDSVFVYITRPSEYDVRGDWYKPLADRVDFELQVAPHGEEDYIFVHVTDTHISRNPRSHQGLSRFVREVNALSPRPRFVVNSGDLLDLHKALISKPESGQRDFRTYVGIMNHLAMPYYNVAGDHTDSSYRIKQFPRGDHRCGKPLYWEHLGPHFFSFEYGKIHFTSIDFGYHLGKRQIPVGGELLEYPTNEVQPMHVEWIKQDLAHRAPGTFVVTTSEADLGKHCPGFEAIARQHDIRLQLVGDSHVVTQKSRPVPYRSGGALAGCWWNAKAKQLCPDLSSQGYLIYRVTGEKLEHFYKGLGQRIAITSHRLGAPLRGRVEIQAHLVQPRPDETLLYTTNGKSWQSMREIGRPFYRALYSATVDTNSLPDGLMEFAVRSSTDDEVCSREFVVVNGDDSTPRDANATLSFDVSPATSWTTPRTPSDTVDILFNGNSVGVLEPDTGEKCSFTIPAAVLREVNALSFRFAQADDGFSLGSPQLTFRGTVFRDPRDDAIRQLRLAHWGSEADDWGGFIAGDAEPPDESPFHRRQNVFCFLLPPAADKAGIIHVPAIDQQRVRRSEHWQESRFRFAKATSLHTEVGEAALEFEFEGTGVAVRVGGHNVPAYGPANLGTIVATVDGRKLPAITPRSTPREIQLASDLSPGKHTVRLEHRADGNLAGCRIESFRAWNTPCGELQFGVTGEENAHLVDCRAILRRGETVVRDTLVRNWLTGQCSLCGILPGDDYSLELRATGWVTVHSDRFRIDANTTTTLKPIFLRRNPATVAHRFRSPRLNQPAVRRPGETFRARFLGFDATIDEVKLTRTVGSVEISRVVPFREDESAAYYYDREVIVELPDDMPAGVYDLSAKVTGGRRTGVCRSPRSVHILKEFPTDPVFVTFGHLDTSAQHQAEYLERLVGVINLLAPDMVLCSNACNPAYVSGALANLDMPYVINFGNHQFPGHETWYGDPVGLVNLGPHVSVLNFGYPWHVDTSKAEALLASRAKTPIRVINAFEANAPLSLLDKHRVRMIHDAHGIGKKVTDFGATPTRRIGKTNSESFRVVRFRNNRVESCTYNGHQTAPIPFARASASPLSVSFRHPNDGTQSTNIATVTNQLLEAYPNGRVTFVVSAGKYKVDGGRLESQALSDDGRFQVLSVRVDIPAKGSAVIDVRRVSALTGS